MYTIFCLLGGEVNPFPVNIDGDSTVGNLKKLIQTENLVTLKEVNACSLKLYHVNLKFDEFNEQKHIMHTNKVLQGLTKHKPLKVWLKLLKTEEGFPDRVLHILVQFPPSELIHSRACDAIADMHPPNCNNHHPTQPSPMTHFTLILNSLHCTLQQMSLSLWLLLMLSVYFNDSLTAPLSSNSMQQPAFRPSNHSVDIQTLVTPLSLHNTITMYLSAGTPYH